MEQEQFEGLKVKAMPRSCGTQVKVNGAMKHFGVNYVKVQKIDPQTKKPMVKNIDGKDYPVFEQKRDPETGDLLFDPSGKPIYVTKAVPDSLEKLDNQTFVDLIVNKKAVSDCAFKPQFNTESKKFYIVEDEKWVNKG